MQVEVDLMMRILMQAAVAVALDLGKVVGTVQLAPELVVLEAKGIN
jgi:hypothetical protein